MANKMMMGQLAILAATNPDAFIQMAVAQGLEPEKLNIPGIGKKTSKGATFGDRIKVEPTSTNVEDQRPSEQSNVKVKRNPEPVQVNALGKSDIGGGVSPNGVLTDQVVRDMLGLPPTSDRLPQSSMDSVLPFVNLQPVPATLPGPPQQVIPPSMLGQPTMGQSWPPPYNPPPVTPPVVPQVGKPGGYALPVPGGPGPIPPPPVGGPGATESILQYPLPAPPPSPQPYAGRGGAPPLDVAQINPNPAVQQLPSPVIEVPPPVIAGRPDLPFQPEGQTGGGGILEMIANAFGNSMPTMAGLQELLTKGVVPENPLLNPAIFEPGGALAAGGSLGPEPGAGLSATPFPVQDRETVEVAETPKQPPVGRAPGGPVDVRPDGGGAPTTSPTSGLAKALSGIKAPGIGGGGRGKTYPGSAGVAAPGIPGGELLRLLLAAGAPTQPQLLPFSKLF